MKKKKTKVIKQKAKLQWQNKAHMELSLLISQIVGKTLQTYQIENIPINKEFLDKTEELGVFLGTKSIEFIDFVDKMINEYMIELENCCFFLLKEKNVKRIYDLGVNSGLKRVPYDKNMLRLEVFTLLLNDQNLIKYKEVVDIISKIAEERFKIKVSLDDYSNN